MPAGERQPVAAAAAIALRGEQVLLVQRGREPNRGEWSIPGGSILPGETARAAAAREVFEETGLRVAVLDAVDVYDAIFPAGEGSPRFHYCAADFLAEPLDPTAQPVAGDDAADARWVPLSEVEALRPPEPVRVVIRRAVWLRAQRRPPYLGMPAAAPPDGIGERQWEEYFRGSLYVVTADRGPGRGHPKIAAAALAGGARLVQLRDKRREAAELVSLAREMRPRCAAAGALFVVNDRADVAVAAEAAGLHLGQEDLPIADARRLAGPGVCLGVSVESPEQAQAAEAAGADYLGVGDLYGTSSKSDAGVPVGLEHLRRLRAATRLPIVAIGGITLARVGEVMGAGADAVAVISAVADAPDMEAAARDLATATAAAWHDAHPSVQVPHAY
jgi:thiamine-phosphate pyrophosphorylase